MSGPTTPDDDRQRRLEEAVAEYLIAADAGRPPEPESFLARYPDLGVELAEFLADLSARSGLVEPLHRGGADGPGARAVVDSATGTETTIDPAETPASGEESAGADVSITLPGGTRVRYFGDYELIRELGRGGMGVVYKARQLSLNRLVGLKMIRSAALASGDELRRFQNEAETVATLDHPHIVPILEVGNHDGQHYFTMKLVSGSSLDRKLAEYVANPTAVARLMMKAAEGVHHAHRRGILHRDLKPSNILVEEG